MQHDVGLFLSRVWVGCTSCHAYMAAEKQKGNKDGDDTFATEARLIKKLKKGKITQAEYDQQVKDEEL